MNTVMKSLLEIKSSLERSKLTLAVMKGDGEAAWNAAMNAMMAESRNAADSVKGSGQTSDRKRIQLASAIQDKWRSKLDAILDQLPTKLANKLRSDMEARMGMFLRAYM